METRVALAMLAQATAAKKHVDTRSERIRLGPGLQPAFVRLRPG
jgi:hypothetical protein